ncbi:MAG: hypothetical protein ACFFDI_05915 [Promethearchaeota archaeon]
MKRSNLTVILSMISMLLVIVSFFFTSQLDPDVVEMTYLMGIFFFLFTLIGIFFAYKERIAERWDFFTFGGSFLNARIFILFGAAILQIIVSPALWEFLLIFFTAYGRFIPQPWPITRNLIFILLWATSSILLILAAVVYEDQETKRWI